jgi:O-antigen/teichoic acid export membrane protein
MKKDVIIYFLGKSIPAIVSLVMIVLVVRFLGEDQYGKYSLIVYIAILVTQLSFTWIQQSMIRFLSFYKEKPGEILSRLFFLTVISTVPAILIMFLVCHFYFNLNLYELLIVVFYTSMYILFIFRLTLYQAYMKPLKYASYESIYSIFLLVFLFGFIYFIAYKNFIIVFISMGAGFLLTEIVHGLFLAEPIYKIDLGRIHWDKIFTKKVMDYGLPLTIWIFISTFTMMADRYIIKEFDGYAAAGTYAAIKDLVTKISTFTILPISIAYSAKINDAWNSKNSLKAKSLIREALVIELIVGLLVSIGFLVFCQVFYSGILHLRGEGLFFTSMFLIASVFLWQGAMFFQKPLELLYKQRTMVLLILLSLGVNVLLNLILIPKFGFPAAAVNALVSVALYSLLSFFLSRSLLRRHLLEPAEAPSN